MLVFAVPGRDHLIAHAAVEQMPLHRCPCTFRRAMPDGIENLFMLTLESFEVDAPGRRLGGGPDRAARDNKAAEIFEEAPELRVAGPVGNRTVKGEVLVDGD